MALERIRFAVSVRQAESFVRYQGKLFAIGDLGIWLFVETDFCGVSALHRDRNRSPRFCSPSSSPPIALSVTWTQDVEAGSDIKCHGLYQYATKRQIDATLQIKFYNYLEP